jgi:hypothetical protein
MKESKTIGFQIKVTVDLRITDLAIDAGDQNTSQMKVIKSQLAHRNRGTPLVSFPNLTSKINQMYSMFQRFANSFTNARPSKIVGHSGQQLIECQDDAGDADADLSTPQKRAR